MIAMMGFYGKVPYGPKGVLTSLLVIGTGTIIAWAGGCDHDLCEPAQTHYASIFNQNRVCMVVFVVSLALMALVVLLQQHELSSWLRPRRRRHGGYDPRRLPYVPL